MERVVRLNVSCCFITNMGFLVDTQNCELRMRRECQERFPRHRVLAIPTYITARWRTCHDECRGRYLAVSFEVGVGENVPGIPGAGTTHILRSW